MKNIIKNYILLFTLYNYENTYFININKDTRVINAFNKMNIIKLRI